MEGSVRNPFYDHPELYELIYPKTDEATPAMCLRMFDRFLNGRPRSFMDVGCGTGRDLAALSRSCPDCWGIDYLPHVIEFAVSSSPTIADCRTLRTLL
jgi:SAM-dependent methyltransferase